MANQDIQIRHGFPYLKHLRKMKSIPKRNLRKKLEGVVTNDWTENKILLTKYNLHDPIRVWPTKEGMTDILMEHIMFLQWLMNNYRE